MTLNKYVRFVARAKRGVAYWTRIAMRDFTDDLLGKMAALKMNNAALATAASVSPAYITKVLRGSENFTLETMTKLAMAVGGKVRIHVASVSDETYWIDRPVATTVTVVNTDNQSVDSRMTARFFGADGSSVYAKAA